jgi:phage-related baseplate assembly protein
MALELLNIDTGELLDLFRKTYYEQTGETLQIGSDEFATAAVYAYVWGVLMNRINVATQNRYIDTASGEYLDALAANYGIKTRPAGYHANARFQIVHAAINTQIPAGAIVVQDSSGNQFTNPYIINLGGTGFTTVQLYAVEAGVKYNGIPAGSVNEIVKGSQYIGMAINTTSTDGGTDGFPYTEEGDAAFREWLKLEIQSFAGAGTYLAFEARARNASSLVKDAYVLRQSDSGYQAGKVKVYILGDANALDAVTNACNDDSFRPIGDLVEVVQSAIETTTIPQLTIQVTYPSRFMLAATSRNERILSEYDAMLRSKINKPFSFEELCAMFTQKDTDGVYALDAKPLDLTQYTQSDLVYPAPGNVLGFGNDTVTLTTVYSNRGA